MTLIDVNTINIAAAFPNTETEVSIKKLHNFLHRLKVIQLQYQGVPILGWNIIEDATYNAFYLKREGF